MDQPGHVEAVRKNRSKIEQIVRIKYLSWPVEEPATVLLERDEVRFAHILSLPNSLRILRG